jgi:hypothetical protein
LPHKWTRKRLFMSILTRPATAGHGFLKECDLCGLELLGVRHYLLQPA